MTKKKSDTQIVRDKIGVSGGGAGLQYEPPSARRTMMKCNDDPSLEEEEEVVESLLRLLVREIVEPCDDEKYCLYTRKKDPKTGKRRRLGTHPSKEAAYRQEYAISKN